jgi:hypothetical protein
MWIKQKCDQRKKNTIKEGHNSKNENDAGFVWLSLSIESTEQWEFHSMLPVTFNMKC